MGEMMVKVRPILRRIDETMPEGFRLRRYFFDKVEKYCRDHSVTAMYYGSDNRGLYVMVHV